MPLRYPKILFAMGLCAVFSLSLYSLFRITVTIESILNGGVISDVITIFFFLAEFFILIQSLGYFFNILRSLRQYKRPYIRYDLKRSPAVDVLIPVHDEPSEIVFKSIVAAKHIDYENFRIVIVDNSEKKEAARAIRALCEDRDIDYFEAPYPRHGAKAGAINEYLKKVRAPFIAIFDADYRPSRDFLKLTVPQMEAEKKLAFIQTPQFYGNLKNAPVSKASQMQQSIFYEYICEGKSLKSASFMCGTNLLIRTEALRDVGGFDEVSITEDFATSLKMLLKGWKSKYYNQTTAFGDGPLNIREFFRQQYRWARGTLGVFFSYFRVIFFSSRLSFWQRVEFALSGSYYMVGIVWLVLLIMPILYILFSIPSYMADPTFYLWTYLPYFILSFVLFFQTLFIRHYHAGDWLKTQSLALLTAPIYARAAFNAMLGRRAHFEKTRKDASIYEIPWDQLGIQISLIVLSGVAIIAGILRLTLTQVKNVLPLVINIFWCLFHFILLSYLLLHVIRHKKKLR